MHVYPTHLYDREGLVRELLHGTYFIAFVGSERSVIPPNAFFFSPVLHFIASAELSFRATAGQWQALSQFRTCRI